MICEIEEPRPGADGYSRGLCCEICGFDILDNERLLDLNDSGTVHDYCYEELEEHGGMPALSEFIRARGTFGGNNLEEMIQRRRDGLD